VEVGGESHQEQLYDDDRFSETSFSICKVSWSCCEEEIKPLASREVGVRCWPGAVQHRRDLLSQL
jgi:hypothetical protein